MNRDNKLVLILERSSENLDIKKDGSEIVLEGIFAQFGVVNNNDRLYEESEYLPHLEYLQKKIKDKRLLGELDHPEKFDISLSKVSHVIEKLEYDKSKRQIVGRVRILDTPSGRIARELVESGVPVSISSRAAGLVESNKKVKIKKIFTYDLVADPGFENAVLSKMNESLGILNENVAIYDVSSNYPDLLEDFENDTDKNIIKDKKSSDNMEYVTSEELNTYSLVIKEEVEELNRKIANLSKNSDVELSEKLRNMTESIENMQKYIEDLTVNTTDSSKYMDYLAEKLDKVIDYTDYVAKTLDESIQYSSYIAEKTDNSIQYGEYLKEQIEKGIQYSEYLKECLEKSVSYTEYVAEKTDKSIQYSEYVAEQATKGIAYTEYVAEQATKGIEKGIQYAEYIGENLNDAIQYADYLGESLNKGIAYTEYIGEQTQSLADYTEFMLNESGTKVPVKTEPVKNTDYNSLTGKVDQLLESIQKQKIDNVDSSINEARKQKVSEGLNENNNKTTGSALRSLIGESKVENIEDKWLTEAPEEYKTLWESLDSSVQATINAQSKYYKLDTPYQIKNFWQTRNLNGTAPIVAVNENQTASPALPTLGYDMAYLDAISKNLDRYKK